MGRYRVTMTVVYDVETTAGQAEVVRDAEVETDGALGGRPVIRRQVRVEKLKDKRRNVVLGEFRPEEVLSYVSKEEGKREYAVGGVTYQVRMNSQRYFVFRESRRCVACGVEGTKMILEQNPADRSPHFNLYAVENGRLVLMTKDHVQPKAYGGEDRHSNFQTMCTVCNNLKGSANLTLPAIAELRRLYNENRSLPRKKLREVLEGAKKSLAGEHGHPHVSRFDRRRHLAERKSKEPLVANTDIHVWRLPGGGYAGRSVYENPLPDAVQVACVRHGTELEAVDCEGSKVAIRLADDVVVLVYQGYVDVRERAEERSHDVIVPEFLRILDGGRK